ncbi:MAG TPA: HAD family phosphatase [Candidatus Paceibacterota bacterium]|nr:HAD family phosphatase [Candidatus Paceibacterota bacterium]
MTCPRIIVFDLGKVLVDFDFGIAARRMAPRSTLNAEAIQDVIQRSPLIYDYESGRITTDTFFQRVQAATGFQGTQAEFGRIFSDIFSPIEPMVAAQAQLRQKGCPTYIFSNTNELAVNHIRQSFPFFSHFTGYIYSYEHKAMKPDFRIYEALEKVSGFAGHEVLYLDDRSENVEAGRQRGWQGIVHEDPETSLQLIRKTGLL